MSTHIILSDKDVARFEAKVDRAGLHECWLWTAGRNAQGYGSFRLNGKNRRATHIALIIATGNQFPEGADACHHCDNPPCVNPEHLFIGDAAANVADMRAKGRNFNSRKKSCLRGHSLTDPDNLLSSPKGSRLCKQCHRQRVSLSKARTRARARSAISQGSIA